GPRRNVPDRPRHPDDPGPAPHDPDLRDVQRRGPDDGRPPVRGSDPRPGDLGDQRVPAAPILPDDPEGPRGGGPHRWGGVLHDLLPGDAPARDAGPRRRHDPPVPGQLEQLLLAGGPHSRQRLLDPAGGPHPVPARGRFRDELAAADGDGGPRHHPDPGAVPVLPALLRGRDRRVGGQGLTMGHPFRDALSDLYFNSWRLVPANVVWGVVLLATLGLGVAFPPALGLLVL